jgi:acyl-CoA hydrolase
VVAFVDGARGLEVFNTRNDILTAEPKIPFNNIIKGLNFAENSPVMKAISEIPDGAKIFVPIAAGASPDGVTALIQQSAKMQKGFDVHVLVNGISEATLQKGIETTDGKFRVHSLFLGGNLRKLYTQGKVSVIPGYLSDFTRHVRNPDKPEFHYDAILVRVAPKDEKGRYSLGANNDMIMTILRNRPGIKIIAEVNENVPRTTGDNFITEQQITSKFTSTAALAGPPVVPLAAVENSIGQHLGTLIPDRAVLQIGIGNIFGGLPQGLAAQKRQGIEIFTEMFGDPLREIMQNGNATKAETGFAYGSKDLYQWLNNNPNVRFVETEYVNSPGRVADKDNFHAVNTALQVTLRGDVNATHGADGGRISSPGGQVEFMSGAARSVGGKAIIAIRSTAKNGTISAITLNTYGGNVTTPHESVTHVVTEYGVAVLGGKSESQRAMAMIGIAHPNFRAQLKAEAIAARILTEAQAAQIP